MTIINTELEETVRKELTVTTCDFCDLAEVDMEDNVDICRVFVNPEVKCKVHKSTRDKEVKSVPFAGKTERDLNIDTNSCKCIDAEIDGDTVLDMCSSCIETLFSAGDSE